MKFPRYHRQEPVTVKITPARVVIVILSAALAVACGAAASGDNAATIESKLQNAIALHYDQVQPAFVPTGKSQMRANLNELEQAEVIGAQTTSFECGTADGCDPTHPPIKSCPSKGAPIASTDELTNPQQPIRQDSQPLNDNGGNLTIGQMDPNGLYPGTSTGTWVRCIGAGGAIIPSYYEGYVAVEFAPAQWVKGKGIVDTGPPSFKFTG